MKEDGEVRCYLLIASYGTGSGQRGREQSQLAGRELFPRERLMSVAWATVEREPPYEATAYAPRIQEGQINYIRHLSCLTHGSYTIFVGISISRCHVHTVIPFQPHAHCSVNIGSKKAGVG